MLNNQIVTHNGRRALVTAVNGGWSTIVYWQDPATGFGGEKFKVRNGALTPEKAEPVQPAKKMTTSTTKTPAHFIHEVTPTKPAKIKDTHFDLSNYFLSDVRTPAGRRTLDCADDISVQLRGLSITEVYDEASKVLGESVEGLKSQYEHLNIGMQRMNLGNRIRGAVAKAARKDAK